MTAFRPQKKAWLPLLIVSGPLAVFGAAAITDGGIWGGLFAIALAAIVVGYNGTILLTINAEQVTFKRFGLTIWSAPRRGTILETGRGGDIPVLPAYVFMRHSKRVGYVLRGWFTETDIAALRVMLANGS